MATVTFDSTDIWSDASNAGRGSVDFAERTLENYDISRPIPRGDGNYLKLGGRGGVQLGVAFTKQFSAQSDERTFRLVLEGLQDGRIKTLTVTGHGSVANCRLVEARANPTRPMRVGSTTYQIQDWFLIFERMR